jgi:hypothetical protein
MLTLLIQVIDVVSTIANKGLNISIADSGSAYAQAYEGYVRGQANYSIYQIVKIFLYTPLLITLILGPYYYKHFKSHYKISIIAVYLSIIYVNTLGQGKMKQFGDLLVFFLSTYYLKQVSETIYHQVKKKGHYVITLMVIALFSLSGFLYILSARYSAIGINEVNINEKIFHYLNIDKEHFVFTVFGNDLGFVLSMFSGYLTGGYYGLSLSMQQPFVWTYFVGNSYSLTVLLSRFLGLPVTVMDSYPYRSGMETGWAETKWHSIFPWFASDFTFIGTLFLFSFVAYIYAVAWKEAYLYRNPISVLLFSTLTLGLIYVPANNQLFHSPEGVLSTMTIMIVWIMQHKRYNIMC